MSAPPEANSEYSRGSGPSRRLIGPRWDAPAARASRGREGAGRATAGVVSCTLLGALLVLVGQFTALYQVHVATSSIPIRTVGTGANHAWAPIPIALLAAVLAFAVYRQRNGAASGAAFLALATLGIAVLLIALLGDLPDAHATGLIGSSASQYVQGTSTPSAGLYMETLGAVLLLISGGVGVLMLAGAPAPTNAGADQPRRGRATSPDA